MGLMHSDREYILKNVKDRFCWRGKGW